MSSLASPPEIIGPLPDPAQFSTLPAVLGDLDALREQPSGETSKHVTQRESREPDSSASRHFGTCR